MNNDKAVEFIRTLKAIEDEMEPYKEAKRELRKNFRENGWLSTEEQWAAVKAFRMIQKNYDIDNFSDMHKSIFEWLSKASD